MNNGEGDMKRSYLFLLATALILAVIPGCNEDSVNHAQPPTVDDPIGSPVPEDVCDPQCSESEECIESSCQPKEDLCDGKVCSQDEQCVQDDCVPITVVDCSPECTDGNECIHGVCVPIVPDDPCLDKLCPDGEECNNGECYPLPKPSCGEEICLDDQICHQEHCIDPTDLCGDTVCPDTQKCIENTCVDKDDCDNKNCEESTRCVLNENKEGVCLEEACIENDAPKVCGENLVCKAGLCVDTNCEDGTIDEKTGKCTILLKSIELAPAESVLLLNSSMELKATIVPANATNRQLVWDIKNVSDYGREDAINTLVQMTSKDAVAQIKSISIGARKVEVTVSSKEDSTKSAKAVIELKPYTFYTFPYDKNGKVTKDILKCNQYGTSTTRVFNHDLYTEYVYPVMLKSGSKVYGTRASVVAAARFLTLQFPYFLYYYDNVQNVSKCPTESHYVWSSGTLASKGQDVRIFGLNLTKNAYNSYESGEEHIVKTDVVPWSCDFPNKKAQCNGSTTTDSSGNTVSRPNGLACSGFVAWAFRNGRFYVGDWWTHVFGPDLAKSPDKDKLCKNSSGKIIRNFYCENIIHGVSPDRAIAFANPNNKHDYAHSKLKLINDEKDYVKVSTLTQEQLKNIKAGDLLWHKGHIAMIIGIDRKSDDTDIYVGEASARGNSVVKYTFNQLKNCSKWSTPPRPDLVCNEGSTDPDKKDLQSYVIKMDNVYNYYSKSNGLPEDGNTYKYTDMWPK